MDAQMRFVCVVVLDHGDTPIEVVLHVQEEPFLEVLRQLVGLRLVHKLLYVLLGFGSPCFLAILGD